MPIFPQEARLRNLTYCAPLYVEMSKKVLLGHEDPDTGDTIWETEQEDQEPLRVFVGRVCARSN